jgi:hypothetical protein
MWIEESLYKNNMISFRELYQFKIKNILENKYCPYPSYINSYISYIKIENEIKKLIISYNKKKYYKPVIQLYSLHNNKQLTSISPEIRLNSFCYIIEHLPNAYYYIIPIHSNIIHPTLTNTSTCENNVKICCIVFVMIISCFLYYKKVTVKKNIMICCSLLLLLLLLWKL